MTAADLTEACLTAIDAAGALNAFVHNTPEIAARAGQGRRCAPEGGRCARNVRHPAGDQGPVLHQGRALPGRRRTSSKGFLPEYESHRHQPAVRCGRGDAGQAEHGRIRHGHRPTKPRVYGNAVNPWRRGNDDAPLTPGGSSGGSAAAVAADLCLARHRHRHRRLDPPARRLYRHRRDQADLRALFALGHRRLCLVARSGRADDQDGARRGDHAGRDVRP